MIRPMITILTLYRQNPDIFNGLQLPARPFTDRGYDDLFLAGWDLDTGVLVENLLMDLAELNVIYTDPEFMQYAIAQWSKKELHIWQALYETLFFKYNPIWNKDGTQKETATETRALASGGTVTKTTGNTRTEDLSNDIVDSDDTLRTDNLTDTNSGALTTREVIDENTTNGSTKTNTGTQADAKNGTVETKVSAFNESTYRPRDQVTDNTTNTRTDNLSETISGSGTTDADNTTTATDTRAVAHTGTENTERDYHRVQTGDNTITDNGSESQTSTGSDTGTVDNDVTRDEYGNIGVVTTQAMIREERALVQFNIYDFIIASFKRRFCVMIY